MSKKEETTSKEVYSSILNGRVDLKNDAKNPLARKEVRYFNPKGIYKKTGEQGVMQSQNYLEMQDLIVPVILRENNGTLEFAMQYEYIPATNKVNLELPDCPFFYEKKSQYSDLQVCDALDERMKSMGLAMQVYAYLDRSETAVSQSFTDQQAKFVKVFVETTQEENEKLQWFPITSLENYLATIGENSSLQTKYALQLFYEQYKKQLSQKEARPFIYDETIVGEKTGKWQDKKNIMEHKYRFGIELAENDSKEDDDLIPDYGKYAEYGQSKNSVQCLMVRKTAHGIKIGLSKQQRSPFVEREGVDEYFYEAVAGMLEEGETYQEAAKRESLEEAGVEFAGGRLIHLSSPAILSKATEEYSDFYMYEMKKSIIQAQQLDEQENIEGIEWFDLEEIDLEKLHAPLPTKYLIAKAKEFYERERGKQMDR